MSSLTPSKSRKPAKRRRKASAPAAVSKTKFEKTYGPLIERMVDQAIEDRLDAIDGLEALREGGEETPHAEFWKKRGL